MESVGGRQRDVLSSRWKGYRTPMALLRANACPISHVDHRGILGPAKSADSEAGVRAPTVPRPRTVLRLKRLLSFLLITSYPVIAKNG
jgi:hypothetical protein